MAAELVWAVLGVFLIGLCAWVAWGLALPPRCPRCQAVTEPQPTELLAQSPPVFRVGYRCPRCERVVAHRAMGTWD